jgi:hypothetical protein
MFKHKLIALILVVTLLFGAVSPAWADSFAPTDLNDNGSLISPGWMHHINPCEDTGASGCNYG